MTPSISAASAWSSATNLLTASTTRAGSSIRRATCTIGGPPKDGKEFEKRVSCVADEYSNFVAVDDLKLNGRLTLGENTADNGGARIALAWRSSV
jgi:hypothetical protein